MNLASSIIISTEIRNNRNDSCKSLAGRTQEHVSFSLASLEHAVKVCSIMYELTKALTSYLEKNLYSSTVLGLNPGS